MCVGGQGQLTAESKRDQLLLNISKKPNELLKHFYVWIMFQKYLGCTAHRRGQLTLKIFLPPMENN